MFPPQASGQLGLPMSPSCTRGLDVQCADTVAGALPSPSPQGYLGTRLTQEDGPTWCQNLQESRAEVQRYQCRARPGWSESASPRQAVALQGDSWKSLGGRARTGVGFRAGQHPGLKRGSDPPFSFSVGTTA